MRERIHKRSIILIFSHQCSQLPLALIIIHTNMTFIDTNRYINKDASFVTAFQHRIEFIRIKCRAHDVQTKFFRNFRKLVSDIPIFSCNDE